MNRIVLTSGSFKSFASWVITAGKGRCRGFVAGSIFDRSLIVLRGIAAQMSSYLDVRMSDSKNGVFDLRDSKPDIQTVYCRLSCSYEAAFNAVLLNKHTLSDVVLYSSETPGMAYEAFYNFLMKRYTLPLLSAWMPYILNEGRRRGCIDDNIDVFYSDERQKIPCPGYEDIPVACLRGFTVDLTENVLEDIVSVGLRTGSIFIGERPISQTPMLLVDLDSYFEIYGERIVNNLKSSLKPLMQLKGGAEEMILSNRMC